jgi:hypothetical protein
MKLYLQAFREYDLTVNPDKLSCYATTIVDHLPTSAIRQWDEDQRIPWGDSRDHEALSNLQGQAIRHCGLTNEPRS